MKPLDGKFSGVSVPGNTLWEIRVWCMEWLKGKAPAGRTPVSLQWPKHHMAEGFELTRFFTKDQSDFLHEYLFMPGLL